jgi:hypothetical protein
MDLHVPISEDLTGILDRVLNKSIVVESWIRVGLPGVELRIAESAVYVGYGDEGTWKESKELGKLFPFWRRDLWTK